MEEIEQLLQKARKLAAEKGYPFFCSCADLDTGRACISIGHKNKDDILRMLTSACTESPELNTIIRGVFIETMARLSKKKMIVDLAKKNGKAN